MDQHLEQKIRFLRAANTEGMEHSERGLLEHLIGRRRLLLDWGARPELCDAGLFHSVYGTEHYQPTALPTSKRKEVEALIGAEAEMLVWIFCFMRRETFDENLKRMNGFVVAHRMTGEWVMLSRDQFSDLVNLTFANTLEAFPRLSWNLRRACRAYLKPFLPVAMEPAQRAFQRASAPTWKFWK